MPQATRPLEFLHQLYVGFRQNAQPSESDCLRVWAIFLAKATHRRPIADGSPSHLKDFWDAPDWRVSQRDDCDTGSLLTTMESYWWRGGAWAGGRQMVCIGAPSLWRFKTSFISRIGSADGGVLYGALILYRRGAGRGSAPAFACHFGRYAHRREDSMASRVDNPF